jgi:glycosyltransferase involved in cell wall biosynthesis
LLAYLRRVRPDVVHSSVPEADAHTALIAPLLRGTRVVLDEAGMPGRRGWRRLVFAAMNRSADAIVAVSQALRDYLIRSELVPAARIWVIPSCGDPRFFEAPKTDYSARSPFRVVTVGRLVQVKNKAVLVEALARVAKLPVELVIIGDGPLFSELERRAAALGVSSRVSIPGFVPNLLDALRTADAYALPSHSEGCSLSLIEAMAVGLPVIASAVPGNEEVLAGMPRSALVPPMSVEGWAHAIERLVRSSETERAALGEQARRIALERFSPRAYVNALEDVYRSVSERRVRPS